MLVYKSYDNRNLISLLNDDGDTFQIEDFSSLVNCLLETTNGSVWIHGARPDSGCYQLKDLYLFSVIEGGNNSNILSIELTKSDKLKRSDIIWTMFNIWQSSQHCEIIFLLEEYSLGSQWRPWSVIARLAKSYVIFKDAEENVIWIGKSDELSFLPVISII